MQARGEAGRVELTKMKTGPTERSELFYEDFWRESCAPCVLQCLLTFDGHAMTGGTALDFQWTAGFAENDEVERDAAFGLPPFDVFEHRPFKQRVIGDPHPLSRLDPGQIGTGLAESQDPASVPMFHAKQWTAGLVLVLRPAVVEDDAHPRAEIERYGGGTRGVAGAFKAGKRRG
jgi:hypothetical protein